ncbi:CAAX prenyl protease 1 [Tulasnella sp. 403]|nr:CAAX prenyl protease 1 [Tulasnella sp. 403]
MLLTVGNTDIESVVTAEKQDNPLTQSHPISSVTREELDTMEQFPTSISIKLTDFSSAALFDGPHETVIQPVALRAPEVILKCGWDSGVDIWSLGCIVSLPSLSSFRT